MKHSKVGILLMGWKKIRGHNRPPIDEHHLRRLTALRPEPGQLFRTSLGTNISPDPLIVSAQRNRDLSMLCRLPEEILVEIMRQLDGLSIFCLRRSCRLFLRLFSGSDFTYLHDRRPRFQLGPWKAQATPTGYSWLEMRSRLRRDMLCYGCKARLSEDCAKAPRYMHCEGCSRDHPISLFSVAQRAQSAENRKCIAHDGYVRICEHRVLKLSKVLRFVDYHHYHERPRLTLTCYHPSHIPAHHKMMTMRARSMFPSATIEKIDGSKELAVKLTYTGHLNLRGHEDGCPITAESFRKRISELRQGPGGYIAPDVYPGIPMEMRCFDPTRCGCLMYAGSAEYTGPCQDHEATRTPYTRIYDHDGIKIKFASCQHGKRCLTANYSRVIQVSHLARVKIETRVDWYRGVRMPAHILLRRSRDACAGRVPYGWYQALAAASYARTEDQETYHRSWCQSKECINYHEYAWENLIRNQPANTSCYVGCEWLSKPRKPPSDGISQRPRAPGSFPLSFKPFHERR